MKEELIKYVMERANQKFHDDFPIYKIEEWIREFFDQSHHEHVLFLICHKCSLVDVVLKSKAEKWKCPYCEFKNN